MPPPINEVDVDYEAQIQEIRRLVMSTTDPERRLVLEDQLRELELASIQQEHQDEIALPSARQERRKSFRPNSAKPRGSQLTPLTEDKEVHQSSITVHELEVMGGDGSSSNLILEVVASSCDVDYAPTNVLTKDLRSFWMTSGMYPQQLRLTLREPMAIGIVEVTFRHVRRMQLRSAPSRGQQHKMQITEIEFSAAESGKLSTHRFALDNDASRTEIIEVGIESAYNDFAVVYFVRLRHADPLSATDMR